MPTRPSKSLDTFANPSPGRDYLIRMQIPEFTCLCPMTGQPDFATLFLDYVPDRKCVELKSLKLYVWSLRNEGAFHEAVTNRIGDDLVKMLAPRLLRLVGRFFVRGGITTSTARPAGSRPPGLRSRLSRNEPETAVAATVSVREAARAVRGRHAQPGACPHQPRHRRAPSPDSRLHQAGPARDPRKARELSADSRRRG